MYRNLLAICLAIMFTAACVPAASDRARPQSTDAAKASETTHEEEDDHGDEDADEHGFEEGEYGDDDIEQHEHDDEDQGAGEHRDLGAHEHGAAELTIAWSGSEMAIDLQTPGHNVLGFEYAPTSEEEQALLAASVAALEAGNLLQPNPDAECRLVSAHVQTGLTEEAHDDEEEHDGEEHDEQVHSDIDVSYNLACQQPDSIESLDASALFAQFPNFEDIQVQWISDTQQSATILTPDNPSLSFK